MTDGPDGLNILAAPRAATTLLRRGDLSVTEVRCRAHHTGWSDPEPSGAAHQLVLARHGRFRREGETGADVVDRHLGYLSPPGEEQRFAHPYGGDVCTAVGVTPALWPGLAGERPTTSAGVYVDARLDLLHRRVLRAATDDPDYALVEQVIALLGLALAPDRAVPAAAPVPAADRRAAGAARVAVADGHRAAGGLVPLAGVLGLPPHRLSRAFSATYGVSLTRYRNRVRVGAALDRLDRGEADLAALAADLGFADQAHLCRTVRQHVGETPTALRQSLGRLGGGDRPPGPRRGRR